MRRGGCFCRAVYLSYWVLELGCLKLSVVWSGYPRLDYGGIVDAIAGLGNCLLC
jgi:hypothetical protein